MSEDDGCLSVSENDVQYSFKYSGALSCIHRWTVMQSLNCTGSGTWSQWRSVCNRWDRPRSNFFVSLTRRAATLSTRCSVSATYFGAPASTAFFLYAFCSNYGLILYHFRDKASYWSRDADSETATWSAAIETISQTTTATAHFLSWAEVWLPTSCCCCTDIVFL